jgi:arsenical pump membrane protein
LSPTATAPANLAIWLVAAAATGGVMLRPWRTGEAVWALGGAALLVAAGLLAPSAAWRAVWRGADVYLFLAGMMLLAELARREGLFDVLAGLAVQHAEGSGRRLFTLVYTIGIGVTALMSNDATAVVLTPAVCAVARKAGARPLPYLLACAFIANAASFVLPISNPANLVVFGAAVPPLAQWLARFALPSVAAIGATYLVLRVCFRRELAAPIERQVEVAALTPTGRIAAVAIVAVALVLLLASAFGQPLGAATFAATALAAGAVWVTKREAPWPALRGVAWSVLGLVAGLFVLVEGLAATGVVQALADALARLAAASPERAAWAAGIAVALAGNAINNLPAGLIAGSVIGLADAAAAIRSAVAVGIDLGPNLSVTGSLATILWLIAIRRAGESVSAWQFLRVGIVAMPAALLPALGVLVLQARLLP